MTSGIFPIISFFTFLRETIYKVKESLTVSNIIDVTKPTTTIVDNSLWNLLPVLVVTSKGNPIEFIIAVIKYIFCFIYWSLDS